MTNQYALTWSGKWHIINPDHPGAHRYAISLCGSYVYRDDDPQYPSHLKQIKVGTKKSGGDCKKCARIVGTRTPEQILAAVRDLQQQWATAKTWDGEPHMVTRAYAHELAVTLGIGDE